MRLPLPLVLAICVVSAAHGEPGEYTVGGGTFTAEDIRTKPVPKEMYEKAQVEIADTPGLPNVLLIGDSISIGYTLMVRDNLAGKANVHRPGINCASTVRGLGGLDGWLGERKWDVIHFNWGLHDIRKDKGGERNVSPEQYEKNLREIVSRLKQTGAVLVWATTTPVRPTSNPNAGRQAEDVVLYNGIAEKVMKENGIRTDDLYTLALPKIPEIQLKDNTHFTMEGSILLGRQVTTSIEEALQERPVPASR